MSSCSRSMCRSGWYDRSRGRRKKSSTMWERWRWWRERCHPAQGILAKLHVTSQDGMMGRDDRRSRCLGRRTEAESTEEATGDTVEATTGVARTTAGALHLATPTTASRSVLGERLQVRSVLGRYGTRFKLPKQRPPTFSLAACAGQGRNPMHLIQP